MHLTNISWHCSSMGKHFNIKFSTRFLTTAKLNFIAKKLFYYYLFNIYGGWHHFIIRLFTIYVVYKSKKSIKLQNHNRQIIQYFTATKDWHINEINIIIDTIYGNIQ